MAFWALLLAGFCFIGAMALPLALPGWRSLLVVSVAAALFFGWIALEIETPGSPAQAIGSFLGGLLLVGYAAGAIARTVALIGRRPDPPDLTH
jgi:hypothetical protein